MSFEMDLEPETMSPRVRYNFTNGWTASVIYRITGELTKAPYAAVACWPTGHAGEGLTEDGEHEASAEEVVDFLHNVACRSKYNG